MRHAAHVLLLLSLLLAAGCWDRVEVNDLAIVTLVGLDQHEDGIKLSISVVVPPRMKQAPDGGGGGGGNASLVYSASGSSVMDAMRRLQLKLSRRIFWGHARGIIIGEGLAREGIRPVLDFFTRHREPRPLLVVAITPGEAADFLAQQPRLERLLAEAVRETLNLNLPSRVTIREFEQMLGDPTQAAIAPRITMVPADPQGWDPQVTGTAIFQDGRLVDYLDVYETRGLLWLRDEIEAGILTLELPDGNPLSLEIVWGRTTIRPYFRGSELRLQVLAEADLEVYETGSPLDLGDQGLLEQVKGLTQESIALRIQRALDRVQGELGVDALGFGEAVRRGAPLAWEGGLRQRWAERFPTVPTDLEVTVRIRRVGEYTRPLGAPEAEVRKSLQQREE